MVIINMSYFIITHDKYRVIQIKLEMSSIIKKNLLLQFNLKNIYFQN